MDRRFSVATLTTVALLLSAAVASAQLPKLVVSIANNGNVGGVPVSNEDLLLCDLTSFGPGTTSCSWSHFFDGSATGMNTQVHGVDVLPNGSLIIRVAADSSLPDLSAIKRKDLALFIPTDPLALPYTSGEWRLYLDGDAVKGSSDARVWDSVDVLSDGTCEKDDPMTCDVLLSLQSGGTLGGVLYDPEDILRCHPTAFSVGGSITACTFTKFLDSSSINGGGAGSFTDNLFAIELMSSNTLLFRAPEQPSLPVHEHQRDILRYVGTFGLTPIGTTDLYVDGAGVGGAGLDGETIQAIAIYPDDDDDGVPAGIDNCPNVFNPAQEDADGDGIGDVCDGDPDCNDPTQADADGDGVHDACDVCDDCFDPTNTDTDGDADCDPCDYCPFRPDPTCYCGDGVVDAPSEECDLGDGVNGAPNSPCNATCLIAGECTGSGMSCNDAGDCPPGQGCCGNAVVEGDEECDDGNAIGDDLCNNDCIFTTQGVPIIGCEGVSGSHIMPAFVKRASFRDTSAVAGPGFDKWKTQGEFILSDGIHVDPDTEEVRVIFNQAGPGAAYMAITPIGTFFQRGAGDTVTWSFKDQLAQTPGAIGLRVTRFQQKLNRIKDKADGKNVAIPIDFDALGAPPIRLRQTFRIGDDCATSVLTCTASGDGLRLKCNSTPPPPP